MKYKIKRYIFTQEILPSAHIHTGIVPIYHWPGHRERFGVFCFKDSPSAQRDLNLISYDPHSTTPTYTRQKKGLVTFLNNVNFFMVTNNKTIAFMWIKGQINDFSVSQSSWIRVLVLKQVKAKRMVQLNYF